MKMAPKTDDAEASYKSAKFKSQRNLCKLHDILSADRFEIFLPGSKDCPNQGRDLTQEGRKRQSSSSILPLCCACH